jgi:hypothetical protein
MYLTKLDNQSLPFQTGFAWPQLLSSGLYHLATSSVSSPVVATVKASTDQLFRMSTIR